MILGIDRTTREEIVSKFAKRMTEGFVIVAAAVFVGGCFGGRYEPEPVAPAAPAPAATSGEAPAGSLVATGLVEWGRGWYGGKGNRGEGRMTVSGDTLSWQNQKDAERNFELRSAVIKDVWLTCAARPGQNLCLEINVRTLTDLEYHFRDRNWQGGENQQILRIYAFIKANFPQIHFEERVEKTVD